MKYEQEMPQNKREVFSNTVLPVLADFDESLDNRQEAEPPRKRKMPPSDNGDSAPVIPHETLYFDDGNIILIAQTTSYKVHKGILSRHSEVMRTMLQLPQPAVSADELVDGCQLVHLSDTEDDVTLMLSVFYDGGRK